jgi:hypothetical protein
MPFLAIQKSSSSAVLYARCGFPTPIPLHTILHFAPEGGRIDMVVNDTPEAEDAAKLERYYWTPWRAYVQKLHAQPPHSAAGRRRGKSPQTKPEVRRTNELEGSDFILMGMISHAKHVQTIPHIAGTGTRTVRDVFRSDPACCDHRSASQHPTGTGHVLRRFWRPDFGHHAADDRAVAAKDSPIFGTA